MEGNEAPTNPSNLITLKQISQNVKLKLEHACFATLTELNDIFELSDSMWLPLLDLYDEPHSKPKPHTLHWEPACGGSRVSQRGHM